jgi:hypothetical protein
MERRAGFQRPQLGTDAERLARAEANIAASRPAMEAVLTRLCREYAELKRYHPENKKRLANLQCQIEGLDTRIQLTTKFAAKIVGCVSLYWGTGLNSAEVAEAIGLKPPHVRTLIYELAHTWARMKNDKPAEAKVPQSIRHSKPTGKHRCLFCRAQCRKLVCTACHPNYQRLLKRQAVLGRPRSPAAMLRLYQLDLGLCGIGRCKNVRWEGRAECEMHANYYRMLAIAWRQKRAVTAGAHSGS